MVFIDNKVILLSLNYSVAFHPFDCVDGIRIDLVNQAASLYVDKMPKAKSVEILFDIDLYKTLSKDVLCEKSISSRK